MTGWLLRLAPREFRERYGEDLLATHEDARGDGRRGLAAGLLWSLPSLWARASLSLDGRSVWRHALGVGAVAWMLLSFGGAVALDTADRVDAALIALLAVSGWFPRLIALCAAGLALLALDGQLLPFLPTVLVGPAALWLAGRPFRPGLRAVTVLVLAAGLVLTSPAFASAQSWLYFQVTVVAGAAIVALRDPRAAGLPLVVAAVLAVMTGVNVVWSGWERWETGSYVLTLASMFAFAGVALWSMTRFGRPVSEPAAPR